MKDFRAQVVQKSPTLADVEVLLKEGQLAKGLRKARAAGLRVPQHEIDSAAVKIFRSGRAGELLALIGAPGLHLPFDAPTLLKRALDGHDHHTFLKQVHRLGLGNAFAQEIEHSIVAINARAPQEAAAWRRKFSLALGPKGIRPVR
jgi:hypothetical protein